MRLKTRMMLAAGCVSLLALSIPAFSLPSPRGLEKQRTNVHGAIQNKKAALRAPQDHANARAARANRAARLVSMPITEPPKRPMFGWPALVSEARKYLGTNPTDRKKLWCATFMNLVLAKVGYAGTNSDAAKSFAYYGHRVSEPKIGAIAVLTRGKTGGHVGVVSGIDKNGNPIIISGNHGHRVGEATYPRSRVIAYVMPSDRGTGNIQVAERSRPNRSTPEHGLESPIAELLAAIEAEQSRPERPSQQVAQARPAEPRRAVQQQPAEPHRTVQQLPDQAQQPPPPRNASRDLPLAPALAELFGIKDRAQSASPPRPARQLQQRVQQHQPGRLASAEAGLAGPFARSDRR